MIKRHQTSFVVNFLLGIKSFLLRYRMVACRDGFINFQWPKNIKSNSVLSVFRLSIL